MGVEVRPNPVSALPCRRFAVTALAVALGGLLTSGCAAGQADPVPEPAIADIFRGDPDTVLAEVETAGGMCANGPCGAALTIHRTGKYRYTGYDTTGRGQFSDTEMNPLLKALAAGATHTPKAQPGCASAVDGSDLNLTYRLSDDTIRTASSCDYDFTQDPLAHTLTRLHAAAAEEASIPSIHSG